MQRQQIEKMSKHIADLKAAELDLAASELESQRRKQSEIMKAHNLEIEQLKGLISQTTEEVEAMWQAKVDAMRGEMADMEYTRDQLQNERDQLESEKDELESEKEDLEIEKDQLQSEKDQLESELAQLKDANGQLESLEESLRQSREAEQRLTRQLKLATTDHEATSERLMAMEKTLKEYEQSHSTQLQEARSQADGLQSDLEQASRQIEELTTQLATSKQDAENAARDLQFQLSQASSTGAAQNESLAELQLEIASLKKDVFSKTRALDTYEAKITASGANTLDELLSAKALLEVGNTEAKAKILRYIEEVSKLQEQLGHEEATEAEWSQMATELKQEADDLRTQNARLQVVLNSLFA